MSFSTDAKRLINRSLGAFNLKIDSQTAERREIERIRRLVANGHFDEPAFPLLMVVEHAKYDGLIAHLCGNCARIQEILTSSSNFSLRNDYFTTPDAEVLLAISAIYRPQRVIEIGSGNSTVLFRIAAESFGFPIQITSIDPCPRRSIESVADEVIMEGVESIASDVFRGLTEGDVLFVDSSHEIRAGNDVLYVFFQLLPILERGVLIHFHDIFLPYDYPQRWIVEDQWPWTEQYLLNAFLTGNEAFKVIWPGHYLQRSLSSFSTIFPLVAGQVAKSFWMIKK